MTARLVVSPSLTGELGQWMAGSRFVFAASITLLMVFHTMNGSEIGVHDLSFKGRVDL